MNRKAEGEKGEKISLCKALTKEGPYSDSRVMRGIQMYRGQK